jgi:hypothetical protein
MPHSIKDQSSPTAPAKMKNKITAGSTGGGKGSHKTLFSKKFIF